MSMIKEKIKAAILNGQTSLGIELGSTRIKAVLIDEDYETIASGSFDWTNSLVDGIWTYGIDEVWTGISESYRQVKEEVLQNYDIEMTKVGAIGFSAMMHGYMAFDSEGELLVPFRTWRNNLQEKAATYLTEHFSYPIPQRWTIAHLYQAVLNGEGHLPEIDYLSTLAGYVHWQLTGERIVGVGEASGIFPIDLMAKDYNEIMVKQFDALIKDKHVGWKLRDILPKVRVAGETAGYLTQEGALLIDPTGSLEAGIPLCPPEGDAGTGMVATNSVAKKTGNVSAGTSVFAMIVLEKDLNKVHKEIDLVTTPAGDLVAMVHSNNCSSDLDAWVGLFDEVAKTLGREVDKDTLYGNLYKKALEGDPDCGGLLSIGYLSGEHITGFSEGRPLVVRTPDSAFNLGNFMRAHLYTALGALKIGMDILLVEEKAEVDEIIGHGGFFKVEGVGQRMMSAATNTPVTLMETAGEGGAWGIALLGAYMIQKSEDMKLDEFLNEKVFSGKKGKTLKAEMKEVEGFETFMKRYKKGLAIEKAAVENLC